MATISLRTEIADKLVSIFGSINTSVLLPDLTSKFNTDVVHVERGLKFIDEIEEVDGFPSIYLTGASESRQYATGGLTTRNIVFIVRGYIYDESDSEAALNNLMEDVEIALTESYLSDNLGSLVHDIRIAEITSDEGLLTPSAVFEMLLEATVAEHV